MNARLSYSLSLRNDKCSTWPSAGLVLRPSKVGLSGEASRASSECLQDLTLLRVSRAHHLYPGLAVLLVACEVSKRGFVSGHALV